MSVSRTFDTMEEAEHFEASYKLADPLAKHKLNPLAHSVTLGDCVTLARNAYIKKHPITDASTDSQKRSYTTTVFRYDQLLANDICDVACVQLTKEMVARYFNDRMKRDGIQESTLINELSLFKAAQRMAPTGSKIDDDVLTNHDISKAKPRARIFKDNEESVISTELKKNRSKNVYTIFELLVETGMRIGEVCSLEGQDVDLDNRIITLQEHKTKTKDRREIPLSKRATEHLREFIDKNHKGIVQENVRVFPIRPATFGDIFRKVCDKNKIEDLHVHDMRHVALTRLSKVFQNPMDLAKMSGHKDLNVLLNTYYNTTGKDLLQKMKDFEDAQK